MADLAPHPAPVPLPVVGQPAERSDAAANRERILCAARTVLADQGSDGLTMNAVATAACVGKGTIFRRFGDREGLLHAMIDADMTALQDAFLSGPPPLGPGAPATERLEAFLRALVGFQFDHLELLIAEKVGRRQPPATASITLHLQTLIAQIDPRLDAAVAAELLSGAIGPLTLARLIREQDADPRRVGDGVVALARGLSPLR